MKPLSSELIAQHVRAALAEDVGPVDATTAATIPAESLCTARMVAREPMIIAGLSLASAAFQTCNDQVQTAASKSDGDRAIAGTTLLTITGPTAAILTAERVALNFVQRLSGVATLTGQFVEAVHGTNARILDTRKTTPGLRHLEKYAVACGGGQNHRVGLWDMVLIKDNHLAALRDTPPNAIAAAVQRARTRWPGLKIEVEADTLDQVAQSADAGADIILLDNMAPDQLKAAVRLVNGRAKTEASGGVNLKTVRAIAESGVDFISVGAITHSARAVDIGLDFD